MAYFIIIIITVLLQHDGLSTPSPPPQRQQQPTASGLWKKLKFDSSLNQEQIFSPPNFFLDSFPQNLTNLSTKYQQERSKKNIVMPVLMQKSENFVENKTIQTRTFGPMRNVGLFLFL